MTLDDFFTLTEMNNGLTVPSRVKELVSVMQKQRDCIVKNVSEATRQWSAVGSAIAATENKECLDLFIHLDGLQFIGKWLKDAQKFSNDSSDTFVEESITHLLQALGKLHVDYEKLVATEIWTTVKDLLLHNSPKVQDKAQVLFESWKNKRDGNASLSDVENLGALADDDMEKSADIGRGNGHSESSQRDDYLSRETSCKEKGHERTRDDQALSTSSVQEKHNLGKISDPSLEDDRALVHVGSPSLPKPAMEPVCHFIGSTSIVSCNPAVYREDTPNGQELEPDNAIKSVTESSSQKIVAGDRSLCGEGTSSDGKGTMDDRGSGNQCEEGGEYHKLFESSSGERGLEKTKEFGAFLSGIEDHAKIKKIDLHVSGDNATNDYKFAFINDYKFAKNERRKEPHRAYKKSDIELYGIVDPLEVARQVAIEVEREVVDYKEQSCSSSEKLPEAKPDSPDSLSREHSQASEDSPKEENGSAEASSMQEESSTSTENQDAEQTNGVQDMDTSQVTEAAREETNTEKSPCNFDLNQEVCSEDVDRHANQILTRVSIVSASRATAAPGQPVAPLQFEGNLGWKGSAATSAFRRIPESEKDSSSNISKQRQGCLDIDLNVSESIDGIKNAPMHSSLPSGEYSAETSSRKSERLEFDLNRTSEDGARAADCWSHSSSSSSKQPSLQNINLNDQPSFLNDPSDNSYLGKLSQNFNVSGGVKPNDSVISIMGTRVEVNRKDFVSPVLALPNGRASDHVYDVNLGRTGTFLGIGSVLPYAHYGYNNIAPVPPMPLSSTLYGSGGPIPYMMDSRGAPVIPQIVGSPSGFSQTPFFMNMMGPTPSNGLGAIGPSRTSFDLNSGTMVEGGSRDPSGFAQFLSPNRVRSMDEQLRPNSQPPISPVVGGKRKEPDNGWEHYPFRHYTPPWK
ncbi:hypothetical protein DH2020_035241 [Rehmannia glutinosa]|uniref:TFIIS N-terminal domain-containing protein n=1 Tax=Rehmannia glutinosa TaxID=99300 RepID=A0ABR0V9Y3_REHGL